MSSCIFFFKLSTMHIVLVGSLLSHRLSQTVVELNNDYIPSDFVKLDQLGFYFYPELGVARTHHDQFNEHISNKYYRPKLRNMALVFGLFQSFDGLRVTGKRDSFRYACCTVDETCGELSGFMIAVSSKAILNFPVTTTSREDLIG